MEAIELNEFSDSTNFFLILFLFFIFYIYLNFVSIKIISKISWSEITCNPAYMFFGSLIDSFLYSGNENTVVNFDKCVRQIAEKQLYKEHEKNRKENKNKVNNDLNMIKNTVDGDIDDIDKEQSKLNDLLENTNLSIEETIKKQNEINNAIIDASGNISDLANNIGGLSSKFKTTINSFIRSGLLLLKIFIILNYK